jgi:ArsR family transcriptional regulator, arsenate/arsenite/antimonite-responsive transcriptional repressor
MKVPIRKLEMQLRAVAHARRLGILAHLKKNKSSTVTNIAEAVRLKIPSASQHLRILKAAGIVEHKKRGLYMTYRISLQQGEMVKKVLSLL